MHYSPYFDQEQPVAPIVGIIADYDNSAPYELSATAVFECERGYLIVTVSGCSCWPDSGWTSQDFCHTIADVDKALRGYSELLQDCQMNNWKAVL